MGFACNALAYGVIRRAGSLTLKVLGTVKNVAVVGAGMALFGDRVAALQAVGYAVSIAGFVSYQRVKAGGGGSGASSSSSSSPSSEKEAAAAHGSNGSAVAGIINSKIEAVSSFIPAAKAAALPVLASSAGGEDRDVAPAPAEKANGERRPLLPASFSALLDSTPSSLSSVSVSVSSAATAAAKDPAAAAAPLSAVDAIAAKLSGFFSFGETTAPATTASEIAAGRV